jgi:hypothetical protein
MRLVVAAIVAGLMLAGALIGLYIVLGPISPPPTSLEPL